MARGVHSWLEVEKAKESLTVSHIRSNAARMTMRRLAVELQQIRIEVTATGMMKLFAAR